MTREDTLRSRETATATHYSTGSGLELGITLSISILLPWEMERHHTETHIRRDYCGNSVTRCYPADVGRTTAPAATLSTWNTHPSGGVGNSSSNTVCYHLFHGFSTS
jgi:hypothetical protein